MAVFISCSTDAFSEVDATQRPDNRHVRRPMRGVQSKPDTYATLRVVSSSGEDLLFVDSGSADFPNGIGQSTRYSNFLIQQVQESRIEKQQIIETFGEDYVFFFGERPRMMGFQGILINTADFNWKNEWWENYDKRLRGTKLAEAGAQAYLYFDDVVVSGYAISSSADYSAKDKNTVPFNFQLFVTDVIDLSALGSVYPQRPTLLPATATNGVAALPDSSTGAVQIVQQVGASSAGGGLAGFLASMAEFSQTVNVGAQNALQEMRDTLFGQSTSYPADLSGAVQLSPIENRASFNGGATNQPYNAQYDEYVQRDVPPAAYDRAELARVQQELALRSPEGLDKRARGDLAKLGVDASRRSTSSMFLGRAGFAGLQTAGSFGIRRAEGAIDMSRLDQVTAGLDLIV